MRKQIGLVMALLGLWTLTSGAQTVDLNFDDIVTGSGVVAMPTGYGGLTWAANVGVWGGAQDPYNPHTAPNRVLFNYTSVFGVGETRATFLNGPHVFEGAYFSGSGQVHFNLYNGATLVATSGMLTADNVATFLDSSYSGPVTSVGIVGDRNYFAMDDFIYAVPEPSGLALLAVAGGVVIIGRAPSRRGGEHPRRNGSVPRN